MIVESPPEKVISKEEQDKIISKWSEIEKAFQLKKGTDRRELAQRSFYLGVCANTDFKTLPPIWTINLSCGRDIFTGE